MVSTSAPTLPGPNERVLAAIVFSDVVGYSARMQADEDRTIALVNRDLDVIKELCARHGGRVLKNTGDGLLMFFNSAQNAFAAAVRIQEAFGEQNAALPADQCLEHRIGIHLGDVVVRGGDVLGDGVNIAARLMGEAEPGGICFSQVVYDMVKNRMNVEATYLGPRELKNIRDPLPVYQIMVSQARRATAPVAAAGGGLLRDPRLAAVGVGSLVGLAIVAVLALLMANGDDPSPAQYATDDAAPEAVAEGAGLFDEPTPDPQGSAVGRGDDHDTVAGVADSPEDRWLQRARQGQAAPSGDGSPAAASSPPAAEADVTEQDPWLSNARRASSQAPVEAEAGDAGRRWRDRATDRPRPRPDRSRIEEGRERLERMPENLAARRLESLGADVQTDPRGHVASVEMKDQQPTPQVVQLAGNLPHLRSLKLWPADQITDESLAPLADANELRQLWIVRSPIEGEGLQHLTDLPNLGDLGLGGTQVGAAAMDHVARIRPLHTLYIPNTNVTNEGLRKLAKLPNLRRLIYSKGYGITILGAAEFQRQRPDVKMEIYESPEMRTPR